MNNRAVLTSKALAGYMTTASGKKLVFCFFVNNTHLYPGVDGSREGRALGELCEIVHRNVK
jgi:D-alanyl-D-alanine carboxypeptidase/D-alanyl-D-alanine-endopeptidase (penicillin-binding protein 4)